MSETNNNITVFLDFVGRTIVGELVEKNDTTWRVKNPVVLNVVPEKDGRLSIQLFPTFFKEFLADKSEAVIFDYHTNQITPTSISALDFRLQAQYLQMFNPANTFVPPQGQPAPQQQNNSPVINLFEE